MKGRGNGHHLAGGNVHVVGCDRGRGRVFAGATARDVVLGEKDRVGLEGGEDLAAEVPLLKSSAVLIADFVGNAAVFDGAVGRLDSKLCARRLRRAVGRCSGQGTRSGHMRPCEVDLELPCPRSHGTGHKGPGPTGGAANESGRRAELFWSMNCEAGKFENSLIAESHDRAKMSISTSQRHDRGPSLGRCCARARVRSCRQVQCGLAQGQVPPAARIERFACRVVDLDADGRFACQVPASLVRPGEASRYGGGDDVLKGQGRGAGSASMAQLSC